MDFGVQSGLVVVASTQLTEGRTGSVVRGEMTAAVALRELLKDSGLTFTRARDGSITIQKDTPSPPAQADVSKLTQTADAAPEPQGVWPPPTRVEEFIVTATRREERMSKVPISMSVYDQRAMDKLGVKDAAQIAALTPGVDFWAVNFPGNSKTSIAIRGIAADSGASTIGVYIDDTPIQPRNIQQPFGASYPHIFDLERVEVLRGPQGTLFGAGSEGGTLRFITREPSLAEDTGYARAEVASTEGGAPSYETGAAFGGPLVDNSLGFRLSGWYRKDGGYVDRVNGVSGAVVDQDSNWQDTKAVRAALRFAPTQSIEITPAIFHQDTYTNDASTFWEMLSDADRNDFRSGKVLPQPTNDRFTLSSLKIQADLGYAQLISASSYLDRSSNALIDFTNYLQALFLGNPFPTLPGQNAPEYTSSSQRALTQEVRLQSADDAARLNWVVGAFYSESRQTSVRKIVDLFAPIYVLNDTGRTLEEIFGVGLYQGQYLYTDRTETTDEQLAVYGDVNYRISEKWQLMLGLRASRTEFDSVQSNAGPVVAPVMVESKAAVRETPITPKIGLSYQANENQLFYASATKGYRVGGGNVPVPATQCAQDLRTLGISAAPTSYKSDSVWSYEVGTKNSVLAGRLQLDASVFHIDWSNVQSGVTLACGFFFTSNFSKAASEGFDLALSLRPGAQLQLGLAVGYTDARYIKTVGSGPQTVVTEDTTLGRTPWTVRFSPEYEFALLGHAAYLRGDYVYRSHNGGRPVHHDPAIAATFNPSIPLDPATHLTNLRAGVILDSGLNIALFVDNLFNEAPLLQRWHDTPSSPLYTDNTFRPRTFGITATYHLRSRSGR